jgi:hypothetical protein
LDFNEKDFRFDDRFESISKPVILNGYFQSWKYFAKCEDFIKHTFTNLLNPSHVYLKLLNQLSSEPYTAIHVRRGDYVGLTDYHGLTSKDYFLRANKIIGKYSNSDKTVVFSDDIESARKVVGWANLYIGHETLSSAVETLDIMSRAKNLIGSNSSFSWWSAYLRDDGSGVRILPRPWFANQNINDRDLLCENWISVGI